MRRFPPPWIVETIPGGLKVLDATGQALANPAGGSPRTDWLQDVGLAADIVIGIWLQVTRGSEADPFLPCGYRG